MNQNDILLQYKGEDKDLTKRERKMSTDEIENIIDLYGADVYRFCFHLVSNKEEAEDLYQDTILKAIQLCHKLNRSGNVKSFLMGIAVNIWRNNLRKAKGRNEILPQVGMDEANVLDANSTDLLENYLKKEMEYVISGIVNNLPEKQKVVILLHFTQEYSAAEIAKILRIPRGTVLSRLAKAKATIKSELEEKGYEL